jgi:dihydrofolate reductase
VQIARCLDDALAQCGHGEVFVIGGASLFAEALAKAQRLYLTEIHRAYDGDVRFPEPSTEQWREVSRRRVEGNPPVSFVILERLLA